MRACHHVEIVTLKRFLLHGLWFGKTRAKRVYIFVHGLNSTLFNKLSFVEMLAKGNSAVLTFNNRGHDMVSSLRSADGKKRIRAGGAHEVFNDCVDDIQGAVQFARRIGAREVYLVGHSTGCQKAVYWASKNAGGKGVRGIVLLAPVSDFASETARAGKKLSQAVRMARKLVRAGKKHELLPPHVWPYPFDAQRFLSLYTPDSSEEIFSYVQPAKKARTLQAVKKPVLAMWAEKDEFNTEPHERVAEWFNAHIRNGAFISIPKTNHSFRGTEKRVIKEIRRFADTH